METAEYDLGKQARISPKEALARLAGALGLIASLGLYAIIHEIVNASDQASPTATATPVTVPGVPYSAVLLSQTATALNQEGLRTSFKEESGFTKEMFEEARRGTVLLRIMGDKKNSDGYTEGHEGTGFVLKHDNDSTYIITNKHLFLGIGEAMGVSIWRPGLDKEKYSPTFFTWSRITGEDLNEDIAIIKFGGNWKPETPLANIDYIENEGLGNKKLLVVGFPGPFTDGRDNSEALVLGSVMPVGTQNDSITKTWTARGLSAPGSSGSPAFFLKDNKLQLAGIVTTIIGGIDTGIRELELKQLLDALK